MMRKPMLMGNWKMYKTSDEARKFAQALGQKSQMLKNAVSYVIFAPATALHVLKVMLPVQVKLGAQNVHDEVEGAFTGEISVPMVADFGTQFVLVGHSERRQYFAETDEWTGRKVRTVLNYGLTPVLCVGENLAQRDGEQTIAVVTRQVLAGLALITTNEAASIVIAYEPVWAIGSGKTASAADAEVVCKAIRDVLASHFEAQVAEEVRILYGGSVKPENIASFVTQPNVDGGLVGGASLNPESFCQMAEAILGVQQ